MEELDTFGTAIDIQELIEIRDQVEGLLARRVPSDGITPRAELRDLGDAYRILLEVPGVEQEDLEVAIEGRELVVAGHREPDPSGHVVFSERVAGPFQRKLGLPSDIDYESATAQLVAGLLILHLPKA